MESNKSKAYWQKMADSISSQNETTNKRNNEYLKVDIAFVKRHLDSNDDILDLGAGTGLVTNELIDSVKSIIAVETFEGLTKFIHEDVLVINAELPTFIIRKEFDKIVCTGVTHFFNQSDVEKIYANAYKMLKPNGKLILRSHCGLTETVVIDGFSKELSSEYFTEYRKLDLEVEIIKSKGFSKVEVFDEVADELNVWKNTRHYYFVCSK
jgi:cyclopropane fatty-acyl-phospholipid synthase-like methyltransferase